MLKNKYWTGIGGMFFASLLFGLMAFFVRIVSEEVPHFVIVFIRSIGGVILFLFLYLFRAIPFHPVNRMLLFWRGLLGIIALTLWFYSIGEMSLSKAVFYFYSYPLYTTIFSRIFFNEKIHPIHLFGMFFVLIGLVLLSGFWDFSFSSKDTYAILSGMFAGTAMSTIKELRKTDDPWTIVMVFLVVSAMTSFPLAASKLACFSFNAWSYLIAIIFVATLGQIIVTYAFKYCSATQGGVVASTSIIFPTALGYFILGEKISFVNLLGGIMILSGGIIVSFACSFSKKC